MFKIWFKEFKDNRLLKDITISDASADTRTHKIFHAITKACYAFDLSEPIWLEANIAQFQKTGKVRFRSENFIDSIDFDYLEVHVLEED